MHFKILVSSKIGALKENATEQTSTSLSGMYRLFGVFLNKALLSILTKFNEHKNGNQ